MDYKLYCIITCLLFFGEMFGAIMIPNIAVIFDVIAPLSMTAINLIFPGLFYFFCSRKFKAVDDRLKYHLSKVYMVGGVCVVIFL
jgi:hypothetical protein